VIFGSCKLPVSVKKMLMKSRFVIQYLDNLIAWSDNLFRQDTAESFNEAAVVYLLADNILGKRPRRIQAAKLKKPKTIGSLKREVRCLLNTLRLSVERGDAEYLALVVRNLKLLRRLSALCSHERETLARRRKRTGSR
jgi:hypothetical protein